MKTDTLFYTVFQLLPGAFFELLGQPAESARGYQFKSVEIKEPDFRIDGVFIPGRGMPGLVYFTEVQFQRKKDYYWRLFAAIFLFLFQNKPSQDWHAVAVFARRSLDPGLPPQFEALRSHLTIIYLDELDDREDLPLGVQLVRLIVSKQKQAFQIARLLILRMRQRASRAPENREIIGLVETILLYKFTHLSREDIEAMIDIEEELRKTRYFQDVIRDTKLETVPLLLRVGYTVEQIAEELNLDVDAVRKAAENPPKTTSPARRPSRRKVNGAAQG